MKVALVHDYLAQDGGAERVLKLFHELWPTAPIFVLFHKKGSVEGFEHADIRESFLAKIPFARKKYQWLLPLMPLATEKYNLKEFDVVISSASAFAKGVLTSPETLHICYCHTPTRYLWTDTQEYISELKYNRLIKAFLPRIIHRLRMWDKMSVDRVDYFIANSQVVKKRIQKYYRRESEVIYPSVNINNFSVADTHEGYFLSGGRFASYKRFDLLIHVFNRLGLPLKIFGTGPRWWKKLQTTAKSNIEFLGRVTEAEKVALMQKAAAFLHPQVEDFGITPVEAMLSGCPVIAYGVGGVTETVIPGKTGVFFYNQTWEDLLKTMLEFNPEAWDRQYIRTHALQFSDTLFKQKMKEYVDTTYAEFVKKQA